MQFKSTTNIIESGTFNLTGTYASGTAYYRKYSDGSIEIWGKNTTWSNANPKYYGIDLPADILAIKEIYSVQCMVHGHHSNKNGYYFCYYVANDHIAFKSTSTSNNLNDNAHLHFYVMGRWK